ncbi:MAG: hypothetical protein C3F15_05345 [Holophagae bacterium]|nr:MAG: hypothetical protein C3F15_05345 [Holophagae bacterium]
MYEHRSKPLVSRRIFLGRVAVSAAIASAIVAGSLAVGVVGYRQLEHLSWLDALLNASMILGAMGPVDPVRTTAGKLFASVYALYSGLLFVVVTGIVFAPVVHRLLHTFHVEREGGPDARRGTGGRSHG